MAEVMSFGSKHSPLVLGESYGRGSKCLHCAFDNTQRKSTFNQAKSRARFPKGFVQSLYGVLACLKPVRQASQCTGLAFFAAEMVGLASWQPLTPWPPPHPAALLPARCDPALSIQHFVQLGFSYPRADWRCQCHSLPECNLQGFLPSGPSMVLARCSAAQSLACSNRRP